MPMNSRRCLLLAVLIGVPSLLLGLAPPAPDKPDFSKSTAHKVVRVIDGDTIAVSIDGKETKVRLIGVDTPETVHPQKPVERFGKEASRFTTELLKDKSVYFYCIPCPDRS
jgi:micrococcal nuclease